jgi:hypothetical protein
MRKWNDNFNMERYVNGKKIIVGQQSFENGTILIKRDDNNIIECPMYSDKDGNFYFTYDNMSIYVSEYMGEIYPKKV